jgi:hypothetical protein
MASVQNSEYYHLLKYSSKERGIDKGNMRESQKRVRQFHHIKDCYNMKGKIKGKKKSLGLAY